ncbi:gamma-glutamyl-gamma-aminobutyrate hydrolase family protein [Candidatus Fermentibacterales bacterium]|nr:gamma-glutamyl-gamma-aminobutyrate hydrolase family protein [Candidatus Fermentibacterales bacterium]
MMGTPILAFTTDWIPAPEPEAACRGRWRFTLNSSYMSLASGAGCLPLSLLPCRPSDLRRFLESVDLVVLTGGGDLDPPFSWRDAGHRPDSMDYETRAHWEASVYRTARDAGVPVLGICLGFQVIAILEGARLIPDIPSEVEGCLDHHGQPGSPRHHPLSVDGSTFLGGLLPDGAVVCSYHHQGISRAPDGFITCAVTSDGVVEAFESPDMKVFAVQWHPEREPGGAALVRAILDETPGARG